MNIYSIQYLSINCTLHASMYCGSLINLTFRANIEISSSNSKQSLVLWNWAQGWRSERLFLIRCIIFSLFLFFIFIPPVATRESGEIDTFDMYIVCIYIDRYGYIYISDYIIYIYIYINRDKDQTVTYITSKAAPSQTLGSLSDLHRRVI